MGGFNFEVQLLTVNLGGELRYYQRHLNDQVNETVVNTVHFHALRALLWLIWIVFECSEH